MDMEHIRQNLTDAGCSQETADAIDRLYQRGRLRDALRQMRLDRCRLMDQLHESGRKVDRLDFLIRQTEQELTQTEK